MPAPLLCSMSELNLDNQRVLIREDLNVPMKDGVITNDARLLRVLPTLKAAMDAGARVMVMSHLGRPDEGGCDPQCSLQPVAERLSRLLNKQVPLIKNWLEGVSVNQGDVVLLENVRFFSGEASNSPQLAKQMAALCDVFVMDAFATAHRAQASTEGVARYAKTVCAGPLLLQEIAALGSAFDKPARPFAAIVGGSKVSTKIHVLDALVNKVDLLVVGGGIANTFLKASGVEIGRSLYEPDWVDQTKQLLAFAKKKGIALPLPEDVVVAKDLFAPTQAEIKSLDQIAADDCIFDVGPKTSARYATLLHSMNTIVWNGPIGVFEVAEFAKGTQALSEAIAASSAFSLAGGGDTLAAIDQFGIKEQISYISTGGGAFLEYLEGVELPAVKVLKERVTQG